MANARSQDLLGQLQNELKSLEETFSQERKTLQQMVLDIFANTIMSYQSPAHLLEEDSLGEAMYQIFAPYFVSANSYLKHIREKNTKTTEFVDHELLALEAKCRREFDQLSDKDKRKYLLDLCFISIAILLDLTKFIEQYTRDIEICMTEKMMEDFLLEKTINGITTILLDQELYHPDHASDMVQYRRDFYQSIALENLSTEEFFSIMHGHVKGAMKFIGDVLPKLSQQIVNETAENNVNSDMPKGTMAKGVRNTVFAPPTEAVPAATPAAIEWRRCVIL